MAEKVPGAEGSHEISEYLARLAAGFGGNVSSHGDTDSIVGADNRYVEVPVERVEELRAEIRQGLERTHEGFDSLVTQLTGPIREGLYSSVLIDQRGGSLPAIVICGLMRRWAHDSGTQEPVVVDLPGGKWWYEINKTQYLESVRPLGEMGRSLVVTEVLAGGEGSGLVYAGLKRTGILLDVAAFQTYLSDEEYKGAERWGRFQGLLEDIRIYRGVQSMSGDIFNAPSLVVARGPEEDPAQSERQPYTSAEQAVMIDAAQEYLEALTDVLYKRHFRTGSLS